MITNRRRMMKSYDEHRTEMVNSLQQTIQCNENRPNVALKKVKEFCFTDVTPKGSLTEGRSKK